MGLGPGQKEERLDDPGELTSPTQRGFENASILFERPFLPEGDFDLADQHGERGAQLMRGVTAETPLALVGEVQPRQQIIEGTPQKIELVTSSDLLQTPSGIGRIEISSRLDQLCERDQRLA